MPGENGIPGHRGETGPKGDQGQNGQGRSEVFAIHSFRHNVPNCPRGSSLLYNGYSLASLSTNLPTSSLYSIASCPRRFSAKATLRQLGQENTASVWYGVSLPSQSSKTGANLNVSRCAVCEVEASMLTTHSLSTNVPPCPSSWKALWSGFSYQSSQDSVSILH